MRVFVRCDQARYSTLAFCFLCNRHNIYIISTTHMRTKTKLKSNWRQQVRKYTVYKFTSPWSGEYIGVTHLPLRKRAQQHITASNKKKTSKCPLHVALRASNKRGQLHSWVIHNIANVTGDFSQAMQLERKIKAARSVHIPSLNQRTLICWFGSAYDDTRPICILLFDPCYCSLCIEDTCCCGGRICVCCRCVCHSHARNMHKK